jgi:predicted nucleic acid-binding protein
MLLRSRGEAIGDFDEQIASIALAHGAAIISCDRQFRRVPGLKAIPF